MMNASSIGRDAAIILIMRVAGTALWMVYTIILARTLSQADFAVALYVMNFSFMAILVVTLGRDVALLRFAAKAWAGGARDAVRSLLSRSRRLVLATGGLLLLALLAAALAGIDTPVTGNAQIAALSGLLTVTGALMGLNRECLRAINRVWQSQLGLNFTRSLVPIIGSGAVLLADAQMTAELALTLFLGSLLLSLVVEEMFLRRVDWRRTSDALSAPSHRDIARAGLALWPGDIANALMMRAAGLVGAAILPPPAAAMLLAAERIAGLAQFPIAAAAQASAPRIAQATNADAETVQIALVQGSGLMVIGAALGCGGAALMAWPALWALGPEYLPVLPTTLVLIGASLAWGVFGLAQSTLNLIGESYRYSLIAVAMCGLTVVLIWIGAHVMGPLGVAIAWAAGWWITTALYTATLFYRTRLKTGIIAVVLLRRLTAGGIRKD